MTENQISFANRIFNAALNSGVNENVSHFITEQSAHETNGFQSSLFKRANNAFGMTVPSVRKSPFIIGKDSIQPDGNMNYAKYANIEDSTKDLIHWFTFNHISLNNISNREQYANILKSKGYYGDSLTNYLNGLKTYSLRLAGLLKKSSAILPILFLFAIVLLVIFKK